MPSNSLAVRDGLRADHLAFIDEYMRNGRHGRNAYATIKGIDASKSTNVTASRWLTLPQIRAEIARRIERYEIDAGIKRVEVLEKLKNMLFCDVRRAFSATGTILPPAEWPDDIADAVTGYNAGTVTAAEKITFEGKLNVAKLLLDELRPVGQRKPGDGTTNVQVNVEKMLVTLREAANASLPAE